MLFGGYGQLVSSISFLPSFKKPYGTTDQVVVGGDEEENDTIVANVLATGHQFLTEMEIRNQNHHAGMHMRAQETLQSMTTLNDALATTQSNNITAMFSALTSDRERVRQQHMQTEAADNLTLRLSQQDNKHSQFLLQEGQQLQKQLQVHIQRQSVQIDQLMQQQQSQQPCRQQQLVKTEWTDDEDNQLKKVVFHFHNIHISSLSYHFFSSM